MSPFIFAKLILPDPMAIRHRWTFAEDKLCCQRYVEAYVIQQQDLPLSEFIRGLSAELPQIKPSSLRMKAQNIKQILLEYAA